MGGLCQLGGVEVDVGEKEASLGCFGFGNIIAQSKSSPEYPQQSESSRCLQPSR
ncbi:hypothetical protein D3C87_1251270 [compost metagenome]